MKRILTVIMLSAWAGFSSGEETKPAVNVPAKRIWSLVGPGTGGAMFSIAMHPADPRTFYSGVDMGAMFKTTDGGKTWRILGGTGIDNPNPAIMGAYGIALDQNNPNIVWSVSKDIFKSENAGESWDMLNTQADIKKLHFEHIALDPSCSDIAYVAGHHLYDNDGHIIRTTDGGRTWTMLASKWPDGNKRWFGIAVDPYSRVIKGKGHERIYAFGSEGIYRSENHGEKWMKLESNLPKCQVQNIVFVPSSIKGERPAIFANCIPQWIDKNKKTWEGGVYKSSDDGRTWEQKMKGINDSMLEYSGSFKGWNRFFLTNTWTHPETLYFGFGFSNVYRSSDTGESWALICKSKSKWEETEMPDLAHSLMGKKNYWFLPLLKDNNCELKHHSSMGSILGLAVSPADPNTILFTHNSYVVGTSDGGKTWEELCSDIGQAFAQERWPRPDYYAPSDHTHAIKNRGLQLIVPRQVAFDPFDPNKTIAFAYMDLGLRISRDGGNYWEWAYDKKSMMRFDSGSGNAVVFDPAQNGVLYLGTGTWSIGDIFKSSDKGRTFERLHVAEAWKKIEALKNKNIKYACIVVSRIVLDPESDISKRTIYAGIRNADVYGDGQSANGIYKSMDGGKNWKSMNNGLVDSTQPLELILCEKNPSTLYMGTNKGLFKSVNAGEKWEQLASDKIGFVNENCLAICRNKPETLYVCAPAPGKSGFWSDSTLFRSDDSGKTWIKLRAGFISSVAVNPYNPDWIYITIPRGLDYKERGGILRSKDGGRTWDAIDDSKVVESNSRTRIEIDKCDPRRLVNYSLYGVWIGFDVDAPIK